MFNRTISQSSAEARADYLERLKLNGRDAVADKKAKAEAKGKQQYRQDSSDSGFAARERYLARVRANGRVADDQ